MLEELAELEASEDELELDSLLLDLLEESEEDELELSELELVKKISRDDPVLLLDDVLSELDSSRQNQLLDAIQDIQTMITCTGLEDFVNHRFHIDKIFKVEEGKVTSQN